MSQDSHAAHAGGEREPLVKCARCQRGKDDPVHTLKNYEAPSGQISHEFVMPTLADTAADLNRRAAGDPFKLMQILMRSKAEGA